MSRKLLSALVLLAAGSAVLYYSKYFGNKQEIVERQIVKNILITLRKRLFSTLREISFTVQEIKANDGFGQIKVSQIIIKNGHNAELKLNAIEDHVLEQYHIKQSNILNQAESLFQNSCNYYAEKDIEINILLQNIKIDIQMAMQGTLHSKIIAKFPSLSPNQTLQIYKKVIQRRMEILEAALKNNSGQNNPNINYIIQQAQMQTILQEREQFLEMNGVKDQKQANEKLLLSMIEYHYLNDAFFRLQIEQLEKGLYNKSRISETIFQKQLIKENNQSQKKQ